MSRSDKVYLQDIIESAEIILGYIENKTDLDFVNDQMLQDAVIGRFEIKDKNPGIQWRLMKGMRNKLIHEYYGVSAVTIFATIKLDLPILKGQLANLIK